MPPPPSPDPHSDTPDSDTPDGDAPDGDAPDGDAPDASDRGARRRRWIWPVLIGGVALAIAPVAERLPQRHVVELRLANPSSIESLELHWTDEDGELARTTRLGFMPQGAPSAIRLSPTLRTGPYQLELNVQRVGGIERAIRRLELREDAARTVIDLRSPGRHPKVDRESR